MEAINAVRPKMWQGRGQDLLGAVAYLDVDGVLAASGGERKQGMDISYKGIWGYHPLIVSLANTREVLYVVNRPGNVPSHTEAAVWIDKAIAQLEPHARRLCLRGDTDFSLTRHFDRWAERVDFVFGMDCTAAMRTRAEALEEACWQRLQRRSKEETLSEQRRDRERFQPREKERIVAERAFENVQLNYEDVAEFEYQPRACQRSYRVVALRKNLSKMKGEHVLFEEIRYFFYITTRTDLSAAEVVACANQRCDQENVIEQLKNGVKRPARAVVRLGQQLGLHGYGDAGLEPQVVVRDDDAPQERPPRVCEHGVSSIPPQPHSHPLPRHPPSPRPHRAPARLSAEPGSTL